MAVATSLPERARQLRALGVTRLRLRAPVAAPADVAVPGAQQDASTTRAASVAVDPAPAPSRIRRLALQADPAERRDPAIDKMYVALTEAVSKAGLQPVRVCDVAADTSAAVMVFGGAPVPDGVPLVRVLRADPLAVLHADRERKRRLWEQLLALGTAGGD